MTWSLDDIVSGLDDTRLEAVRQAASKEIERRMTARAQADAVALSPDEASLVKSHRNIEAIKAIRDRTGLSLPLSKRVVDNWRAKESS